MANSIYIKTKGDASTDATTSNVKIGELALNANTGKLFIGTKLGDIDGVAGAAPDEAMWVGAGILDEDAMGSNSATKLATQQSIKAYVDASETRAAQGLQVKANAVATTTGAWAVTAAHATNTITLEDGISSGGFTFNASTDAAVLDTVTLAEDDIVLVKDALNCASAGSSAKSCGLYTVGAVTGSTLVLTRHGDMDANGDFSNAFVFVTGGAAARSDTGWVSTVDEGTQVVGTTLITFAQFNSAGSITAGTGISKVGNAVNLDTVTAILGGTGHASYTVGDITYASTTTALSKLGIGSNGQVLKLAAGVPTWATHAGGMSDLVDDTTPQLGADLDTNGFDIQLDTGKSISFDASIAQTLIGDAGGITYTVPSGDTHTMDVTGTGSVLSVGADSLTTRAGVAHTISVGAATGDDGSSGALTISAGTGTGDEIGGAITLKTGGAVVDTLASTPTVAVNALVLSATGGATFLNTVAAGGNITGNNLSGTNTGDNTTATALTGVPAIAVNTISATGLITCDDITAAADTRITPSVDASDVGGFHFTPGGITEAASGTHPLIAGMTVAPFAVTATGSTVTTIAANVHIDGVPTGAATTGYSLWCGGADGTVDGRIGGAIISGGTF